MTTRIAALIADPDSCIGAWDVTAETCPLSPHLAALNMPPRSCIGGIQTNMQGAVVLGQCEHYIKDTFHENAVGCLILKCSHGEGE